MHVQRKVCFEMKKSDDKIRYNIYYTKFSIIARDYIDYIKVVFTNDIYHEIGKMICTSLEHINRIRYTKPSATEEECSQLWKDSGYIEICPKCWRRKGKTEE